MKKLTKQGIEDFASEVMNYLVKHGLDSDVCIYFNNKRVRNEYDWRNPDEPPKFIVEEDMSPFSYFSYANYDHILSMSFEGPLYDELNYTYGKRAEGLEKIFKKYGVYWEQGNAWNLSAYPNDDDMEIEFTPYSRPKERKYLYTWDSSIPSELREIMDKWYEWSKLEGDKGSCVLGAGFKFTWNGDDYFMGACSPYQGSMSWEASKDKIATMLRRIGAENICYDWGRMD